MKGSKTNSIENSYRSTGKWDAVLAAIESWPRAIRFCVICLTMTVCSGLIWVLTYLAVRAMTGP